MFFVLNVAYKRNLITYSYYRLSINLLSKYCSIFISLPINPVFTKNEANTNEMMADSLINMFNDGPDVSFIGSPTVSPIIAA